MACSGVNPNCCGESNPDCCSTCDCFNFTSSNNTVDVIKQSCKVDIRITSNILQNLIDIPSSSCISIVKQYINGQLVFTPTLNIECVSALIPTAPVIPDVPVYTANNGLLMTSHNTQLGGGDSSPLINNTLLSLGSPMAPKSLTIYQNDSSNTKPLISNFIGTNGAKNTNITTIASGITTTDTISILEQDSNKFFALLGTVKNNQTDIAFLSPAYLSLSNTSIIGSNYPVTVDSIGHTAPANDTETTSYLKTIPSSLELYSKNININSLSTVSGNISHNVSNGSMVLLSNGNDSTAFIGTKSTDPAAIASSLIFMVPGLLDMETFFDNDRNAGSYYAKTIIASNSSVASSSYTLVGAFVPNSTNKLLFSVPANDITKTSFSLFKEATANIYAQDIFFNGKLRIKDISPIYLDSGQSTPCAALDIDSTTGGLLLPRMTTSQRGALSSLIGGLEVFDTDMGAKMLYDGGRWTGYRYNGTTNKFEGYDGANWIALN